MVRKWNKANKTGCDRHLNDSGALSWSTKRTWVSLLGAFVFVMGVGGSVYTTFDKSPESERHSGSKIASLFKKPLVIQPLPDMPSESPPGMSLQPERLSPQDALTIQKIDTIITGPRTHKPRPIVERAASKDS